MISLDTSILYQAVLFVVLWYLLKKILFQPYLKLLEEREQKTTGAQHDSTDLEREGARLRAQYEEKLAQAQAVAQAAKEEIVQSGRVERERILSEARAEAAQILERIRHEIGAVVGEERRRAAAEATALAAEMASKALGRKVA